MAAQTITQIRADYPSVILSNTDLFLLDQANRTIAATIGELAALLRPGVATTTTAGLMSSADKLKLNGIPAGATANSADSFLLNRENHQGQQAIATVTGLGTRLTAIEQTATTQSQAIEALQGSSSEVAGLKTRVTAQEDWSHIAEQRIGDNETAIANNATAIATATAPRIMMFKEYTLATLPSASANKRGIIEVKDAAGGPTVCRSDGSKWLILNTTTEVA